MKNILTTIIKWQDLAARNVLVNEDRICKIADFGMSMEIKMDDIKESLVRHTVSTINIFLSKFKIDTRVGQKMPK